MKTSALILAHYKQREENLSRIVQDLLSGSVVPEEVCVFIDNPEIEFEDDRVTVVRSNNSFMPRVRFALGAYFDTDYCFFIDDDLTVRENTLDNLVTHAEEINNETAIIGLRGSILADTPNPYADDKSIKRGQVDTPTEVDIIMRSYFVPRLSLAGGLMMEASHPELPRTSLDDVYLCMGNMIIFGGKNYVIPVDEKSTLDELPDRGVGQSTSGRHYENRNKVCRYLMDAYL